MKTILRILNALAFLGAALMPTLADSPPYINYQGLLNDENGTPLPTGNYTMEFNIYDHASTGVVIWGPFIFDGGSGDGHGPLVPVANGRFNVIIGPKDTNGDSLDDAFSGSDRFIEMSVNEDPPILPRQQFLSTPFAFRAASAVVAASVSDPNVALLDGVAQQFSGETTFSNRVVIGATDPDPEAELSVDGKLAVGSALTVGADLTVDGHMTTAGTGTVNGEQPPYVINIGDPSGAQDTKFHAYQVPGNIIEEYLGDDDGGTVRFNLLQNSDGTIRTITHLIYINRLPKDDPTDLDEKPLRGHGREHGGGVDKYFTLDDGTGEDLIGNSYTWIWMRDRPSLPTGDYVTDSETGIVTGSATATTASDTFFAVNDEDPYRVEILIRKGISATVIIYDR